MQAWAKRPTVDDFEDMPNAIESVKGFWHNPVTRILLVVALANLGFQEGRDYDLFYTNGPSSGVGNGLGGRAVSARLFSN